MKKIPAPSLGRWHLWSLCGLVVERTAVKLRLQWALYPLANWFAEKAWCAYPEAEVRREEDR